MQESRRVIGYYERAIRTYNDEGDKPRKGFLRVLFEDIDGKLRKINEYEHFDESEKVFQQDGFGECQDRYLKKVVRINAIKNINADKEGQTEYVTFKNNISECDPFELVSFLNISLPDQLNLDVSLDSLPHTKYFFVLDSGIAYGPFRSEISKKTLESIQKDASFNGPFEITLIPARGKEYGFNRIRDSYIARFSLSDLRSEAPEALHDFNQELYLSDIAALKLIQAKVKEHSFVTKGDVIGYLKHLSDKRVLPKASLTIIKKQLQSQNLVFTPEGKEIISQIVKDAHERDEWLAALIDVINNDSIGVSLLEKYVEKEKQKYIEEVWENEAAKKYKEASEKVEAIKQELAKHEKLLQQKQQEVTNAQTRLDIIIEKENNTDEITQHIQSQREAIDKELLSKKTELEKLTEKLQKHSKYESIEAAIKKVESTLDVLEERKFKLTGAVDNVKSQLNLAEQDLQSKLRELVPYVSTIIQAPISSDSEYLSFKHNQEIKHEVITDIETAQSLISNIVNTIAASYYDNYGRSYSNAFIASVLVAFFQSFISVFAGPPGLGKTSFIRLLREILKLDERFLEVSVSRSWVSEREFIGFYNSLSGSFSPSASGSYQFLKGIGDDLSEQDTSSILLLDEANLSPIEHYAASMLNIADKESDKIIRLTNEELKIPETLRVLATINHDMTTEPLSDRLLDRAPVIPFELLYDDESDFSSDTVDLKFSYGLMDQLFGNNSFLKRNEAGLDGEVPELLGSVIDLLGSNDPMLGKPFIQSKRKQEKVSNYVSVLTTVLAASCNLTIKQASLQAVDFTVLYFLLPKINGSGFGTKNRLEKLLSLIEQHNIPRSKAKITDMLARGEQNLDTFNFFHY